MKNIFKKTLCLIIAVILVIGIMPALEPVSQAAAEKITSNDGKWIMYDQQEDNEAWLYRYSGDETDVVIPGEIDGYKITGISSECFTGAKAPGIYDADNWENNDKIKSITIPSTVERIDYRAFFHMDSLEEVVFDEHMTGYLYVNSDAFKFCMSLESLKFPRYCNPEFHEFLYKAYVKRLEVPCINISSSGSSDYAFDLNIVENLTITGDYTFGVFRSFLCTASLKTVEIMGFVTGDNVSRDLCKSNGNTLNKPDIILHNIPSAAVDEGLIELGYHKIFDPDTGITTYTIEGTPDKSYSPVLNDLGNFDPLTVGDFGYVLTYSGNAVITNYWGSGDSISFPSEMQGHTVTAIGADGFPIDTGDAETITIPDTVEYIAKSAFEGNSALQHVDFPGSLKIIEARAFKDCSLKEVILPGVVYAGAGAFENCLPDKIYIPSSLRRIPERMFFEDIGSTSSRLTEVTISEGVRSIGPDAFNYKYKHKNYGNRFTLSLPSTVEQIGARAFYYAGILGDLVLPAGINILSEEAFAYNRLTSVTLPENFEKIEKQALSGNRYTESIIIPAKVFYLEEYALSSLTVPELIINAVIRNIPEHCFYYLTAEKLVIPEGAEQIGEHAFENAKTGELDLPASLIKAQSPLIYDSQIGTLIYRCKNLNSDGIGILDESSKIGKLIIKDTVRELGENIFEEAVITGEIEMEPGVEIIGECAFWHLSAEEIIIPDTVKTILAAAFAFSELKYVRIPESVTLLGDAAFYRNKLLERVDYLPSSCVLDMSLGYNHYPFENCPNLKQFNFGDKIKYIPDNLLRSARGVETVTIPDCVTDIGSYSFADTGLKSIVMPDSLESLGDGCFENCSELESVVINGKVFLIGDNTFNGCNKLREIYIADSVKNIGRNSFSGCESLETVYMSRNVVYIPEECFKNCTALTSFTWESESKLIGKLAFAGCTSLTVFNFAGIEKLFPNSFEGSGVGVVSLGEAVDEFEAAELQVVELQCFRYCASLQTVALGGNVNTVQSLAFADCENLETAIIADSVEVIFPDAFANCPKLTIYCNEDSYAYNYAVENNIPVSTFVVEPIPSQRYTGKDIEPPVNVSLSGNQLSKGVDFKVRYSDNTDVGTAVVKVSGINTYKMFTSVVNFSILTRDISEAGIESISDRKYTGSEITPALTVKYNGKTLRKGVDYNVIYTNNISVGTAKATLTGIGNFSGTASAEFNITESKTDPAITPPWHNPSEDPDNPTVPVIIPPWNDTPDDPDDPVTPPSADPGTPQGDGTPSDSSDGLSLLMRIFSFVLSFARTLFSLIRSLISQIRSTAD